MNAVQTCCLYEPGQALTANTELLELGKRHDTMLIRRNLGDLSGLGDFLTHVRE